MLDTHSNPQANIHTLVLGGGIAGMACAVALSKCNIPVVLVETRKKLGGRATSFTDVRSGQELDNCQHITMGCCTNYLHFLSMLNMENAISWHSKQYWYEPTGKLSIIKPSTFLPAPGHFGLSTLRASWLTLLEKLSLAHAMLAIIKTPPGTYQGRSFSHVLATLDQPKRVIDRFWSPVIVSACNIHESQCDAELALKVFREGFLASAAAAKIGVPNRPLAQLYQHATSIIQNAGGQVLLGRSVEEFDGSSALLDERQRITAQHIVCALPPERAIAVASKPLLLYDTRFKALENFFRPNPPNSHHDPSHQTHSPILGVHIQFDRPVMPSPHAVLVDAHHGTQWVFAKEPSAYSSNNVPPLHAVISAADTWMNLTEEQIVEKVSQDILTAMQGHLPDVRNAKVLWARAVKEKRATFAGTPRFARVRKNFTCRPMASDLRQAQLQHQPFPLLAGCYTDTLWPATMEGAARSGFAAAQAILDAQDQNQGATRTTFLQPDLPPTLLAKLLMSIPD